MRLDPIGLYAGGDFLSVRNVNRWPVDDGFCPDMTVLCGMSEVEASTTFGSI